MRKATQASPNSAPDITRQSSEQPYGFSFYILLFIINISIPTPETEDPSSA